MINNNNNPPQPKDPNKKPSSPIKTILGKVWNFLKSGTFIKTMAVSAVVVVGYLLTTKHIDKLSEFFKYLNKGLIEDVTIYGSFLSFRVKTDHKNLRITNRSIMSDNLLLEELRVRDVPFTCSIFEDRLVSVLFSVLVPTVALLFFMNSQVPQNKNKKSNKRNLPLISFDHIGGNMRAKKQLKEVLVCLKDPQRFRQKGVRIPKGVLLYGPPGTGKTMMAQAVARQCELPFLYSSGSEFAQLYVGMGPKRVRELFEQARIEAPCVIFIDQLDALGISRGDLFTSSREHDMTLNQLLNELDGFKPSEGVLVIGATNRQKTLDKALIRAGRFDKRIKVCLPDLQERREIIEIHLKMKNHQTTQQDIIQLASITKGLSGAELQNIVNDTMIISIERGEPLTGALLLQIGRDKVNQMRMFINPNPLQQQQQQQQQMQQQQMRRPRADYQAV